MFGRLETGHHNLLGLQGDLAPLGISLTADDKVAEVSKEIGFLRGGMGISVFLDRHNAVALFHVEITHMLIALGVAYSVLHFGAEERHDKIIQPHGAFRTAHVGPLLIGGNEGAVVTGSGTVLVKEFA